MVPVKQLVLALLLMVTASKALDDEAARFEDIKYIACQVCDAIVFQAHMNTKFLRTKLKGKQRLSEGHLLTNLDRMCDPYQDPGNWITHMDILEEDDKLKLVDMEVVGDCKGECRTVAKACEAVLDRLDLNEVSEALYLNKQDRDQLTQTFCFGKGKVCATKAPPVPKDRKPGPAFVSTAQAQAALQQQQQEQQQKEQLEQQPKQQQEQQEQQEPPASVSPTEVVEVPPEAEPTAEAEALQGETVASDVAQDTAASPQDEEALHDATHNEL